MADLSTTYMGVKLKNPLILGACNLVTKPETIKQTENAGIGAIVYRSLFEEQIQLEELKMEKGMEAYDERHAELIKLFPNLKHAGSRAQWRCTRLARCSCFRVAKQSCRLGNHDRYSLVRYNRAAS